MKRSGSMLGRLRTSLSMMTLCVSAGTSLADTVSMPTSAGNREFDTGAFAFATLAGPSGEFACFTMSTLSACSPAALRIAALGPDLTTGLTLGRGGAVTLQVPVIGSSLAIWEAGDIGLAGDVDDVLMSVHTDSGWTPLLSFSPGHMTQVSGDTFPSGYETNFGIFSSSDFGIAQDETFDAVRIEACCADDSHFDLLAVAVNARIPVVGVVPEPGTYALLLSGLVVVGALARRRQSQRSAERGRTLR